jgi:glutamate-1-semialdehyde 2,1-aminomutase
MTGVIGRREVMEAAQTTFISSTYWTERIGPAAALATLAVMERERSWEKITATGNGIVERWKKLAEKHGLTMTTAGVPALSSFAFKSPNNQAYRTLISQEMLTKGYLAANLVYTCIEHTPAIVDGYFEALDPIFGLIRECEDGRDVMSLLKGPVAHTTFARLN